MSVNAEQAYSSVTSNGLWQYCCSSLGVYSVECTCGSNVVGKQYEVPSSEMKQNTLPPHMQVRYNLIQAPSLVCLVRTNLSYEIS